MDKRKPQRRPAKGKGSISSSEPRYDSPYDVCKLTLEFLQRLTSDERFEAHLLDVEPTLWEISNAIAKADKRGPEVARQDLLEACAAAEDFLQGKVISLAEIEAYYSPPPPALEDDPALAEVYEDPIRQVQSERDRRAIETLVSPSSPSQDALWIVHLLEGIRYAEERRAEDLPYPKIPSPVRIFIAVIETPNTFQPVVATTEDLMFRHIYHDFIVGQIEGIYPSDEAEVERLANAGDYRGAVTYWFNEIGNVPSVFTQIYAVEAELLGAADNADQPNTIPIAIVSDGAGAHPLPAVNEDLLYPVLYEKYIKPRLGSRFTKEEDLIQYCVNHDLMKDAVLNWFTTIGPRYTEGEDVGCRLIIANEIPLRRRQEPTP